MKKILFISNQANKVDSFVISSILAAREKEFEFHYVSNWICTQEQIKSDERQYNIKIYQIDFIRNPLDLRNYRAYKQLIKLMRTEKYDIVHCNTPIGGLLGRLCAERTKVKKIIYMVHGFHFYKGAPFINNLIYKNVEKWLAKKTDVLVTINSEDYNASKKMGLRNNGARYYLPGVGIDTSQIFKISSNKILKRKELGLKEEDFILIATGRLEKNKNIISMIKALTGTNKKVKLLLCGIGEQEIELKELVKKLDLESRVIFAGFRNDIIELLKISDIYILTSFREGLSRSLMEAMASKLPCIVSDIRGNIDLIENGLGGYIVNSLDHLKISQIINEIFINKNLREKMGNYNRKKILEFDIKNVKNKLLKIYTGVYDE